MTVKLRNYSHNEGIYILDDNLLKMTIERKI